MSTLPPSFNEMQLEILKLFSREMSQDDLKAIKRLIVRYFAQKAIKGANQVWDNNAWTKEDETRLLDIHERTPYLSK